MTQSTPKNNMIEYPLPWVPCPAFLIDVITTSQSCWAESSSACTDACAPDLRLLKHLRKAPGCLIWKFANHKYRSRTSLGCCRSLHNNHPESKLFNTSLDGCYGESSVPTETVDECKASNWQDVCVCDQLCMWVESFEPIARSFPVWLATNHWLVDGCFIYIVSNCNQCLAKNLG